MVKPRSPKPITGVRFSPLAANQKVHMSEIEETIPDGYLYIANISYLVPTKNFVGVYANTKQEAQTIVEDVYGQYLNFELQSIDVAAADIAKAYKKGTIN